MAIFSDTFTDTSGVLLQNHTPTEGTSWSILWQSASGEDFAISSNRAVESGTISDGVIYTCDGTYPSANYSIQCTQVNISTDTDDPLFLMVRIQDVDNFYAVRLYDSDTLLNLCSLYKKVSGTWTRLGSYFNTPANGTTIKLEIIGSTLKFYAGGVELASATDTDISNGGKAGFGAGGGSELLSSSDDLDGQIIDDLVVTDAGGSFSPSVSPSVSVSPSLSPSLSPSASPSLSPSISPSISPSVSPSVSLSPSLSPSISPSRSSSLSPSLSPSISPSISPSVSPSLSPSISPSASPSGSLSPSLSPSISPSVSPSVSLSPSLSPSISPSLSPSVSE